MSNTDTLEQPAGEQPQATPNPSETTGGEEPQGDANQNALDLSNPDGISNALSQLSDEDFDSLLTGEEGESDYPETTPKNPNPEPEPDNRGEQPEKEGEEKGEDPKGEDDPQKAPDRIRLNGLPAEDRHKVTAAINAVKDGTYSNLSDAMSGLFGGSQKGQSPADEEGEEVRGETQAETPAPPAALAAIDQEITDLKAKRTEARGEFDNEKADDLTDQINSKQYERTRTEGRLEEEAKSDKAYFSEFESSKNALLESHPDLKNPKSALAQRLGELRDLTDYRAEQGSEEAIALLDNPRFLESLTAKAAKDLGMVKDAPRNVPPAPTPQSAPRGDVSSAAGGSTPLPTETAVRAIQDMSEEDLMALESQVA